MFWNHKIGLDIDIHFYGIHESHIGKEVTFNVGEDNCYNQDKFYTDSNGLQMQERVNFKRNTWDLVTNGENVTVNYYPINSAISVQCGFGWKTLLNDRS